METVHLWYHEHGPISMQKIAMCTALIDTWIIPFCLFSLLYVLEILELISSTSDIKDETQWPVMEDGCWAPCFHLLNKNIHGGVLIAGVWQKYFGTKIRVQQHSDIIGDGTFFFCHFSWVSEEWKKTLGLALCCLMLICLFHYYYSMSICKMYFIT